MLPQSSLIQVLATQYKMLAPMDNMIEFPSVIQRMDILSVLQVGGAVAVEAQEMTAITLQPGGKGILMHCIPRGTISN